MSGIKSDNLSVDVKHARAFATTYLPCLKAALFHRQFYLSYFAVIRFPTSSHQFEASSFGLGFAFSEEVSQSFHGLI
jgi:hypothetical protein